MDKNILRINKNIDFIMCRAVTLQQPLQRRRRGAFTELTVVIPFNGLDLSEFKLYIKNSAFFRRHKTAYCMGLVARSTLTKYLAYQSRK
jgi:hypothetical protein